MKAPDQLLFNPANSFINSVVNPRGGLLLLEEKEVRERKGDSDSGMPRRKKATACENNSSKTRIIRSSSSSLIKEKPQQRNAANARERARMRVLSRAFCRLKTTLPWVPADTKLSKLDTLRLASSYIAHLKGILQDDPYKPEEPMHPAMSLTWPFGFNRVGMSGSGGGGSEEEEEEDGDDASNCSSWEEMGEMMMGRRKDCIHLGSAVSPQTHADPTAHTHAPYHHHHPINTNPLILPSSYHENLLSFS